MCLSQVLSHLHAGRHDPAVPRSKRLLSDSGSNILVSLPGQEAMRTHLHALSV
jgi:glycosylphosphatidylinositol transamidase (GPIT) subunit GPI8